MARQPLRVKDLTPEAQAELEALYQRTRNARLRTRAQMILLSTEEGLVAHEIARLVRMTEQTVRNWIKRFNAEGINGLQDAPRPGGIPTVTPAYCKRLLEVIRRRPRALNLPFSLWSLQRLADFMAEETSIRVSHETVRRVLKVGGIVLSRPQHTISSPDPAYMVKKRRLKTNETT